jgi:hypothetical protein
MSYKRQDATLWHSSVFLPFFFLFGRFLPDFFMLLVQGLLLFLASPFFNRLLLRFFFFDASGTHEFMFTGGPISFAAVAGCRRATQRSAAASYRDGKHG